MLDTVFFGEGDEGLAEVGTGVAVGFDDVCSVGGDGDVPADYFGIWKRGSSLEGEGFGRLKIGHLKTLERKTCEGVGFEELDAGGVGHEGTLDAAVWIEGNVGAALGGVVDGGIGEADTHALVGDGDGASLIHAGEDADGVDGLDGEACHVGVLRDAFFNDAVAVGLEFLVESAEVGGGWGSGVGVEFCSTGEEVRGLIAGDAVAASFAEGLGENAF